MLAAEEDDALGAFDADEADEDGAFDTFDRMRMRQLVLLVLFLR